ncbi:hypothetical protein TNIN_154561 [Trichonephila inaurata madagascariensis]|uniref:Uncharacterized protein n=1 Tax=Trichonephila inaurata madagascariensis TaxID=2747483 RepID=A0A8X6YM30_9ARAC|nr:hypothetical protein TNIN_154561 [Trichonephila inaurata madagascariensis]
MDVAVSYFVCNLQTSDWDSVRNYIYTYNDSDVMNDLRNQARTSLILTNIHCVRNSIFILFDYVISNFHTHDINLDWLRCTTLHTDPVPEAQ